MKIVLSALALAAAVALVPATPTEAATLKHTKAHKPLSGTIYGNQRRIGGYSYHSSDVISVGPTGYRNNPTVTGMYPSGPFDMDGFSEIPKGPFGGTTPYMH